MATEHLFDSVSIANGATESATFNLRTDQDAVVYLDADANGTNLDVAYRVTPDADLTALTFTEAANDVTGQDATNGIALRPTLQGADEVTVEITNQGASTTVVDVFVNVYRP